MANAGSVNVDFQANVRQFNQAIAQASASLTQFSSTASNTQRRTGTSTVAIGNLWAMAGQKVIGVISDMISKMGEAIVASSKMALNFENDIMQVDRIFGAASSSITDFASEQARSFGMSTSEAAKYSSVYGNLISNIADSQEENANLTQRLLKQSAVVASATGRTMEDTMSRIRSGLLGNTEAIEDLGIHVNIAMIESTQAFKKFAGDKSWRQLDFKTQQQIRLFGILEQSTDKFGTSVVNSTSAALKVLNATFQDAALNLGNAFLPLIQRAVPILIEVANWIEIAASKVSHFSNILFGTEKSTQAVTTQQKKMTQGIKEADKAAKGALGSFDEINTLQEKIADSAGTAGQEQQKETKVVDQNESMNFPVPTALETSLTKLRETFEPFAKSFNKFLTETKPLWEPVLSSIGKLFATHLIGTVDLATESIKIVTTTLDLFTEAVKTGKTVVSDLGETYNDAVQYFKEFSWSDFTDDLKLFVEEAAGVDFDLIRQSFIEMWDDTIKDLGTKWESIKTFISDSIKSVTKLKWDDIREGISVMWQRVHFNVGQWWGWITDLLGEKISAITAINWDDIRETISQMWQRLKNNTVTVWDGLKDTIKNSINYVIGLINSFIGKVNSISVKIPQVNIPGVGSFGGQTLSFPDIPTIPLLGGGAAGGSSPSNPPQLDTSSLPQTPLANQALGFNPQGPQSNITVEATFQIGETEIIRATSEARRKEDERIGNSLFQEGPSDPSFAGGGN